MRPFQFFSKNFTTSVWEKRKEAKSSRKTTFWRKKAREKKRSESMTLHALFSSHFPRGLVHFLPEGIFIAYVLLFHFYGARQGNMPLKWRDTANHGEASYPKNYTVIFINTMYFRLIQRSKD
ncbi:hypothetical protein CEXT_216161 [Caerostris extrusa]|uniref:Uncharacterized protein n=1 Tax=Caerostris extrusa TaxID=172846 RepID=A0AAV4XW97_CAEEX|nr:hypothetical protein CEXT_216161 [Caerostris extrusa]